MEVRRAGNTEEWEKNTKITKREDETKEWGEKGRRKNISKNLLRKRREK